MSALTLFGEVIDMQKRVVIGNEVYRLKFFINGWEEGEGYFRSIGRFGDAKMEQMAAGKTIERDGDTFCIRYEDEDGHQHTVNDILSRS